MYPLSPLSFFFFFNDTATTEIYTLSLHDALPISLLRRAPQPMQALDLIPFQIPSWIKTPVTGNHDQRSKRRNIQDRKSTRLNSSHLVISYAVFCLKKKKKKNVIHTLAKKHTYTSS